MAIDFAKSGWDGDLNDFIEANSISDTGWQTDGITYQNGCTQSTDASAVIQYRIIQLSDFKILWLTGLLGVPVLDTGQTIVAFTLPVTVASQFNKFGLTLGTEHSNWADELTGLGLNTETGDFSIHNKNSRSGTSDVTGFSINYAILV